MSNFIGNYIYIIATIIFTVYSQIIIKWKSELLINLPDNYFDKALSIFFVLINPWIISSIIATLLAGVSWMLVMSKFEISFAYPFISINFLLMLIVGVFIFGEPLTVSKVIGSVIVMFGLIVLARN
ncbi:hypothetical protein [Aliivibrio wodanis]|uniref:hypothetical protein n=1 Tax=Aliivibrio wodanis TaxID=80852 RepID=UPI00406C458D